MPLYYENRIPELQLVNEDFSDELDALLEAAELDEDAEGSWPGNSGRRTRSHSPGSAEDARF